MSTAADQELRLDCYIALNNNIEQAQASDA
jgi:hypothetical protein